MNKLIINNREFEERPIDNGAHELVAVDNKAISEKEWEEFCSRIVKKASDAINN